MNKMREDDPAPAIKFTREVSLGHLVQVAVVVGGVMLWAVAHGSAADNAMAATATIRADMTSQIIELKQTITKGLEAVGLQIAGLPDQRAQLSEVIRREDNSDQRIVAIEKHISDLEVQLARERADLDSLVRSSNVSVPSRK